MQFIRIPMNSTINLVCNCDYNTSPIHMHIKVFITCSEKQDIMDSPASLLAYVSNLSKNTTYENEFVKTLHLLIPWQQTRHHEKRRLVAWLERAREASRRFQKEKKAHGSFSLHKGWLPFTIVYTFLYVQPSLSHYSLKYVQV